MAKKALKFEFEKEVIDEILKAFWSHYHYLRSDTQLKKETTIGARITVQLAIMSRAFYEVLMAREIGTNKTTELFNKIAWMIYQKMGGIVWKLARIKSENNPNRLLLATRYFRTFPFSSPSYSWKDVPSENKAIVGFDCLKCPVAEYFKAHNLSKFCSDTWCELDFALAEKWESKLIRTGSIAGGSVKCDFRFIANETTKF
jgi:ubiquinone biosynthesis protein